jgi:DNA-directed RNA polymerase subunit F
MSNYELISTEVVSNADAKEIIESKEDERELTYREEKVKDYFKYFQQLNKKDFEKAKKELMDLNIPRLDEEYIIKILDIMPVNGTQLRAIVSHSGTVLVDDSVKKILEVIKKYKK